jgi:hypothetical protein
MRVLVVHQAFPGRPPRNMMTEDQLRNWVYNTHCSALIKVTGDLSDIFAGMPRRAWRPARMHARTCSHATLPCVTGHTAWFAYESMLRIAKSYNFSLSNPSTEAKSVIFSSYPGFLVSLDDFYITNRFSLSLVRAYMLSCVTYKPIRAHTRRELVVIETSLSVFNDSLYDIVRNNTQVLLSWQRTILANRMVRGQWLSADLILLSWP